MTLEAVVAVIFCVLLFFLTDSIQVLKTNNYKVNVILCLKYLFDTIINHCFSENFTFIFSSFNSHTKISLFENFYAKDISF